MVPIYIVYVFSQPFIQVTASLVSMVCFFDFMGVEYGCACQSTLKSAYRKRALECHPDKGGTEASFKTLQEALLVPLKADLPSRPHVQAFTKWWNANFGDERQKEQGSICGSSTG